MPVQLLRPQSNTEWAEARRLVEEYAESLGLDLSFQDLAHELQDLAIEYSPPAGDFFLATEGAVRFGCVGLRRFSEGVGEVKRLYVRPSARGRGVGRLLAEGIVASGKRLNYRRLLLDTLPSMSDAQSLYASLGF